MFIANCEIFAIPLLKTLSEDHLTCIYSICEKLKIHSENKYISIQSANNKQKLYSISQLMEIILKNVSSNKLEKRKQLELLPSTEQISSTSAKRIYNTKTFFYSEKTGKSILKFECKSITMFRKKIGPFEIPFNKHIFDEPKIQIL